jgi:hypothetical protein
MSRKWHFRDSKFNNFLVPSALAVTPPPPNQKELPMALNNMPIYSKFGIAVRQSSSIIICPKGRIFDCGF